MTIIPCFFTQCIFCPFHTALALLTSIQHPPPFLLPQVDDLRGTPMSVGSLEEIIDDNHAIVSTSVGSEHYVSILSFVDKDQLEPGCSVLLNHKVKKRFRFFG